MHLQGSELFSIVLCLNVLDKLYNLKKKLEVNCGIY